VCWYFLIPQRILWLVEIAYYLTSQNDRDPLFTKNLLNLKFLSYKIKVGKQIE